MSRRHRRIIRCCNRAKKGKLIRGLAFRERVRFESIKQPTYDTQTIHFDQEA
jgi:hypothetical protein